MEWRMSFGCGRERRILDDVVHVDVGPMKALQQLHSFKRGWVHGTGSGRPKAPDQIVC